MALALSNITDNELADLSLDGLAALLLGPTADNIYEAVEADIYSPGVQAADAFIPLPQSDVYLVGAQICQ